MECPVTVFDWLLAIGRFLENCLETGQELSCYGEVELALDLDAGQLEELYQSIQAQAASLSTETVQDLVFCCELGLDACDALFHALAEGVVDSCREAMETAQEARRLFWSAQDSLDELRQECCLLA